MPLKLDPKRWAEGFQDAYAGHATRVLLTDDHSYSSGRVEGDALRASTVKNSSNNSLWVGVAAQSGTRHE